MDMPASRYLFAEAKLRIQCQRNTPANTGTLFEREAPGGETLAEIGRSYNVSGWTIARLSV